MEVLLKMFGGLVIGVVVAELIYRYWVSRADRKATFHDVLNDRQQRF